MSAYGRGYRGAPLAHVFEPEGKRVPKIGFGREAEDERKPLIEVVKPLGWKEPQSHSEPLNQPKT